MTRIPPGTYTIQVHDPVDHARLPPDRARCGQEDLGRRHRAPHLDRDLQRGHVHVQVRRARDGDEGLVRRRRRRAAAGSLQRPASDRPDARTRRAGSIRARHCAVGRVRRARSSRARGTAVSQKPRAGRRLARGSPVSLVVSRGRGSATRNGDRPGPGWRSGGRPGAGDGGVVLDYRAVPDASIQIRWPLLGPGPRWRPSVTLALLFRSVPHGTPPAGRSASKPARPPPYSCCGPP